jgi:murein DD-endopeptidase MepM/ murein hydrolase activator NlpD
VSQKLLRPVSGSTVRDFGVGGNEGIDFAAPIGTGVKAADSGTVALISESSDDTAFVLLRHSNNLYTVYGNLGDLTVKRGDKVSRGQTLGKVNGGSPPNLHFEVRKGTEAVDPKPFL